MFAGMCALVLSSTCGGEHRESLTFAASTGWLLHALLFLGLCAASSSPGGYTVSPDCVVASLTLERSSFCSTCCVSVVLSSCCQVGRCVSTLIELCMFVDEQLPPSQPARVYLH